MKTKILVLFLLIPMVFSCKSPTDQNREMEKSPEMLNQTRSEFAESDMPAPPGSAVDNKYLNRKVIKSAYINMEVSNYETSRKKLGHVLVNYKSYIVSENLQNTTEVMTNNITIKVPAALFDELIAELSKLAKRIDYQNIDSQDITEEYIDIETRMKNMKKVEQTYLRILRRTKTIDDILKIENKLGEIRTEIETLEGRMKYIKHEVEYSTINLTLYQKVDYIYQPDDTPSFFQRFVKALDRGWKNTVTFFLFLLRLWPVWLIAAAIFFGWRGIKRIHKNRKSEKKRRRKLEKKENQQQQEQVHP